MYFNSGVLPHLPWHFHGTLVRNEPFPRA
jgi:hypothetical protein